MKGVPRMAAYTIEDIELIRRKSGISYQEAVALLDYHNGNVARALVDLERNGRIKSSAEQPKKKHNFYAYVNLEFSTGLMSFLHKCYRARVKIRRENTPILNVSALFAALALLISPHLVIIAFIVCLVLGYKLSFDKHDHAFDGENLGQTVRSAAENVKASVEDIARGFHGEGAAKGTSDDAADHSYYADRPANHRPSAPTMNVPVQVESQDGKVTLEQDKDGYASATVE